jgi:hypothetical protein
MECYYDERTRVMEGYFNGKLCGYGKLLQRENTVYVVMWLWKVITMEGYVIMWLWGVILIWGWVWWWRGAGAGCATKFPNPSPRLAHLLISNIFFSFFMTTKKTVCALYI